MPNSIILAEISIGELIDKITILEIKEAKIDDPAKLANIRHELAKLRDTRREVISSSKSVAKIASALKDVNEALWDIEDKIRDCERKGDFGSTFVELARSVYQTNDKRATLKRQLNEILNSTIIEEKSYVEY